MSNGANYVHNSLKKELKQYIETQYLAKLNFQTNLDTRPGYFDSKIDL